MGRSLNRVELIGNLARAPELKTTQSGKSVASFAIATNKTWKDANGDQQESVQFHNITAWGRLAEICGEYLSKGSLVYAEGELTHRSWEDEDGNRKYRTEVVISEMKMLGGKREESDESQEPRESDDIKDHSTENREPLDPIEDDELPF